VLALEGGYGSTLKGGDNVKNRTVIFKIYEPI